MVWWLARLVAAVVVVAACSDGRHGSTGEAAGPPSVRHGHVEGAQEVAEAQVALAFASAGATELSLLDLATGDEGSVELQLRAAALSEDGRFVYVHDGDRAIEVVDSGAWTVDHGDHVHYYRAPARSVGVIELDAPATSVVGNGGRTAIGTADGTVTVLDRKALERGEVRILSELESDAPVPFAVPVGSDMLLATPEGIVPLDPAGERVGELAPCADPGGWALLRSGLAVSCDAGVLVVKGGAGSYQASLLPYPSPAPRATGFEHRPRSNEAAATAGADGVWSVDVNHERLVFTPARGAGIVAATSPADERHVLSLDAAGTVRLTSLVGGGVVAEAALDLDATGGSIEIDVGRAYVADPANRRAVELDYRDGLRVARFLPLSVRPDLFVEVGR